MNLASIRQFVRTTLLQERAATLKTVHQQNLALLKHAEKNLVTFVLFDRSAYVSVLSQAIRAEARANSKAVRDYVIDQHDIGEYDMFHDVNYIVQEQCSKYIIATINVAKYGKKLGHANGAWQVHGPAAVHKFGPLMYDIAMATVGEIMPDRTDVSRSARSIWKYYKEKRSDVVATPLDDINNPQTPQTSDDSEVHDGEFGNFIDCSYRLIGPGPDTQNMKNSATQLMDYLETKLGIPKQLTTDVLFGAAALFFEEQYDTGH